MMNPLASRIRKICVAGAALVVLAACNGKPKQPSTEDVLKKLRKEQLSTGCKRAPIEIFLQASPYLNQNAKGQPMPVEVRVMLLKERQDFDGLEFETVWQRGAEALSADLVKSASLTVYPGKLKIYTMKSTPEVGYVALIGIFRKPPADGTWSYVADVREQNKRCANKDTLHTIVSAVLRDNHISKPEKDSDDVDPKKDKAGK